MIAINDLRIGNFITDPDLLNIPSVVVEIKYGFIVTNYNDALVNAIPIKLTKEILDKCGFKNSEWEHKTKSDCLFVHDEIIHIMDARDKNYSFTAPCKYLHQLQNLYYCLTGNELEVVW